MNSFYSRNLSDMLLFYSLCSARSIFSLDYCKLQIAWARAHLPKCYEWMYVQEAFKMPEVCSLSMSVSHCFQTQLAKSSIIKTHAKQMDGGDDKTSINTSTLSAIVSSSYWPQNLKLIFVHRGTFISVWANRVKFVYEPMWCIFCSIQINNETLMNKVVPTTTLETIRLLTSYRNPDMPKNPEACWHQDLNPTKCLFILMEEDLTDCG